ncbi:cation/multidrug efflux pump [Chthonomonas calidirosea]|uniref:Cation/multidrug efflux pump n=1 Tax=Chthonomonas calidirosea (strain DSM 23976 / ICMP 18418 / T49) TaxID=1303518 RepID=S0EUA8_CHTCT|nr:efflux RND transporter permease subunit [Chthonomonas calidirosea]CCW33897.1 Cation/multidrug efflux pump [Chthonomonas calidirosea T49]CEK16341.1 cation/multidrug efflux pump [Chthonomonas calidirosea]
MWITRLAISRPLLVWMILLAITVLGILAYFHLPVDLNPRVTIPTITITTVYPGAAPSEVETEVTKPLEDAVGSVAGLKNVYSSSQPDVSIISMDFVAGTDVARALAAVRQHLQSVHLPAGAQTPQVSPLDINAQPVLYLGIESPSLNSLRLRQLADDVIAPRLRREPGVGAVEVYGGRTREIDIRVDPLRLQENHLTLADVINSLQMGGHNVPAGSITQGQQQIEVRFASAYTSLQALRNTVLLPSTSPQPLSSSPPTTPSLPSPPLTLADVADVSEGYAPQSVITRINGHKGVSLVVVKAADASAVTVVEELQNALAQLHSTLPPDVHIITLQNTATIVREALQDVDFSLLLGAFLAMGVVLLFLHNLRGTLIVSLAIPTCIIATFLVMYLVGFTLNQMTLLALSLSVGILVDDSIVVLESITRHLNRGETPIKAAYRGRAEIGFASLAITLTDVVVFVPIAFTGGIVGSFFKQFGLSIVFATLFSLLVSFTLTPMLASTWYRAGETIAARRGIYRILERIYVKLEDRYRQLLGVAMRRRWTVLIAGGVILVAMAWLALPHLGFEFLPGIDQGQISVTIEMPPGSSLNATDQLAVQVERTIATLPETAQMATTVGQILGGFGSIPQQGPQFAQVNVQLKPRANVFARWLHLRPSHTRLKTDSEVAQELQASLAPLAQRSGARIVATAVRSVVGVTQPIDIQLRGADIQQLARFAAAIRDRLTHIPGVLNPDVSVRTGKPEVTAAIVPFRAASFNLPPLQAGTILHEAIAGASPAVYRDGDKDIPLRVHLAGLDHSDLQQIGNIVIGYDSFGQPILLADVADLSLHSSPTSIDRQNGERMVAVTADLAPDAPLGNIQQRIQRQILNKLPHPGIKVHWGGDAETLNENVVPFATSVAVAALLVYVVMAILFNNPGTPFVIMFTLPMALAGALGALVLTGETLSLVAAIGVIMLLGLMGRNAILLLDYTNTLRARGEPRDLAIQEAGATRLRPILMTTIATILGMLPIALRIGQASEIRAPMAIVVIGGLLVSTLLTLVAIPVIYTLFDDLVLWLRQRLDYPARPSQNQNTEKRASQRVGER